MDEALTKQLVKQLKILNFWIRLFGILVLATLAILGFMLYKIVTFVHETEQKVSDLQQKTTQTLDVQRRFCNSKTGTALLQNTDICK